MMPSLWHHSEVTDPAKAALGTMFGFLTGSVHPVVRQRFSCGFLTKAAGLGCITGCVLPRMSAGTTGKQADAKQKQADSSELFQVHSLLII